MNTKSQLSVKPEPQSSFRSSSKLGRDKPSVLQRQPQAPTKLAEVPPILHEVLDLPDQPLGSNNAALVETRSLSNAPLLALKKKICTQSSSESQNQSVGTTVRAIAANGAGTVTTTYTPEAKDKSTKIVFIQVMRELLDGLPVKPSVASAAFAYQDADTTSDFYHVDYISGEKDPYYSGDDAQDSGTQGNAISTPKVAASTSDTPNYNDGSFPAGKSKLIWDFRTAAFSAAGDDAGTYYGYADWIYAKDKGMAATTSVVRTSASSPGNKFENAVKLWNSNHGFTMPSKGGFPAVLVGAGLTAAGIGIGAAVGGPIGALVGGLIGLAAGITIGALAD